MSGCSASILVVFYSFAVLSGLGLIRNESKAAPLDSESQLIWRDTPNDGLNTCYLLLRLYNIDVDYFELRRQMPTGAKGPSLLDLRDLCVRHGMPVTVTAATPDHLQNEFLPVIVHSSLRVKDPGSFAIVLSCSDDLVFIIDGSFCSFLAVPMDKFRREWSGYILKPDRAFDFRPAFLACGACLAGLSAYWIYRLKVRSTSQP
jgi:Peptidase C39 family